MEINDLIQEIKKQLDPEKLVAQLTNPDISQYEVGRIRGQIEMLNRIEMTIIPNREENKEEENEVKRKTRTEDRISK